MSARLPWVLLSGALFGNGLALATMTQPEVVLSFLHFQDLGLLLVLGGAVVVTLVAYQLVPKLMPRPIAGERFAAHAASLDRRTLAGAAIFGVGWGLCGVCPGPAVAGLGAGNWPLLFALAGLLTGAFAHGLWAGRRGAPRGTVLPPPTPAPSP